MSGVGVRGRPGGMCTFPTKAGGVIKPLVSPGRGLLLSDLQGSYLLPRCRCELKTITKREGKTLKEEKKGSQKPHCLQCEVAQDSPGSA